jgi:preprotein translocase subunit SecG
LYVFLLIVLILDGLVLATVVLLQSGQGGGLAAMGGGSGTDNLIGGRQAVTLLTKMTWITGGLFLGIALMLSVLSSRATGAGPVLRDQFQPPAATTPAPAGTPAPLPGTQPANPPAAAPTSTTGQ